MLGRLREPTAIEYDANMVMVIRREEAFLSREEARKRNAAGVAQVIVAKQRNGPRGEVLLCWREEYLRFEPVSSRDEKVPAEYDESGHPGDDTPVM